MRQGRRRNIGHANSFCFKKIPTGLTRAIETRNTVLSGMSGITLPSQ